MARLWAKATAFGLAILFARFGEAQAQPQDPQPAVLPALDSGAVDPRSASRDVSAGDANGSVLVQSSLRSVPVDRNRDIYYKNKLEFALDVGWLPLNIPFPFDFMMGANYNTYPLKYTLLPVAASLRWQMGDVKGPWVLRGNWDLTCSLSVTAIPRGPETRYFAYMMAMRRNFVPRNRKAAPYIDWRAGLGNIDAKGPLGVQYAQGQNFTFTLGMASGMRYNFNSRFGISAGLGWMHVSNADLSQRPAPIWGLRNYGINVVGPMFGIDARLGGPKKHPAVR